MGNAISITKARGWGGLPKKECEWLIKHWRQCAADANVEADSMINLLGDGRFTLAEAAHRSGHSCGFNQAADELEKLLKLQSADWQNGNIIHAKRN